MRKTIKIIAIIIAIISLSTHSFAQKQEIKAFQEMNKELIKSIKKQYKKDPKIEYSDGVFLIVVDGKVNKQKKYMVLNDEGVLLTAEPVSSYKLINSNYMWISQAVGDKSYWGAVNYKTGDIILPAKYTNAFLSYKCDAGKNDKGVWHGAYEETWLVYEQTSNKTLFISADGKNVIKEVYGKYEFLEDYYVKIGANYLYGLYTRDGRELFPRLYNSFEITKDGFVITVKSEEAPLYGGKSINPELPQYDIKNDLIALKWENSTPLYKVHKDDEWTDYSINPDYKVEYVDIGQKYYDWGQNEKVIAYYEGEGMDAPHGGYYMGLAAKNIADVEFAKLEYTIRTLKDPKNYYLPVKYPDKYQFNSMILGGQYIVAQDYLEKFIKNTDIDPNDPRILKAKKFRGEASVSKTAVPHKIEEYTNALTAASAKYTVQQQNEAIRQAEAEALSNSIATGITNLLFGK